MEMHKLNSHSSSDSEDERVVSSIRTGMKREFDLMMRAQSELGWFTADRRRVTRSQAASSSSSKGDLGSEAKNALDGDEAEKVVETDEANNSFTPLPHIGSETIGEGTTSEKVHGEGELGVNKVVEMKVSKKVESKKNPTKLRDLLETGLLEGLRVRYIHGSKMKQTKSDLEGVIQGTGILCSCRKCKGKTVFAPSNFETHADSRNKRPADYIYLENGKSLGDIVKACKVEPSDSLEMVIQNVIGGFCRNCKGLIPEDGAGRPMRLCDTCFEPKASRLDHSQIVDTAHRSSLVGSSALVCSSSQISASNQRPEVKRQRKLTRKDLRMHKSVLDDLPEGTELFYKKSRESALNGFKKDGAILCTHCQEVVSPSVFEAHAGFSFRRKPYMNIYKRRGRVSLHQLSLEHAKHRNPSSEESDDLCSICEDGGDLLCCANCPRAFHPVCVRVSNLPEGKWYCKYCRNRSEEAKFAGRDANFDEITRRCIRIVETFPSDVGGCAICRGHDFSKTGFNDLTVIICDQCEKEYHVGCLKEKNVDDLRALPDGEWFCSSPCKNINSTLEKLIEDGEQNLSESLLDIVKRKSMEKDSEWNPELDIKWRLLSGNKASEDTRVWLSGAVSIFHDRFDPIADSSTNSLDLIPHMVYGRNFEEQDFFGMYCAVLTVNSVVVSAIIFRVFGDEVAELPLAATRSDHQGKGYFQSLFFCIENMLKSLNVKGLVLPAADEVESLWTTQFGFQRFSDEHLNQYKKSYQLMIFEGTSVLHKPVS